jgi:hypothetical protein
LAKKLILLSASRSTRQMGPLEPSLSSASPTSTRQRGSLCQVHPRALGKKTRKGAHWSLVCRALVQKAHDNEGAFAECQVGHSAKAPSLSLGTMIATFLCRIPGITRQSLCRVPDKKYSAKKLLQMHSSPRLFYLESYSTKSLPSVFCAFCRVPEALLYEHDLGDVWFLETNF